MKLRWKSSISIYCGLLFIGMTFSAHGKDMPVDKAVFASFKKLDSVCIKSPKSICGIMACNFSTQTEKTYDSLGSQYASLMEAGQLAAAENIVQANNNQMAIILRNGMSAMRNNNCASF